MKHLLAFFLLFAVLDVAAQWNPVADVDQDGCIGAGDILDVLSFFGACEPAWQCGDSLEYNNYWYETVLIGEQCWMAENLRTAAYNTNQPIATASNYLDWNSLSDLGIGLTTIYGDLSITASTEPCQDFSPTIDACDTSEALINFGRLYNWHAVASSNLCPQGWHVPQDEEWTALTDYVASVAGEAVTHLKDSLNWAYDNYNIELGVPPGTNMFGFNLQPAGRYSHQGYFYNVAGYSAMLWAATEVHETVAHYRHFSYLMADIPVNYDTDTGKPEGLSVRCLRDAE